MKKSGIEVVIDNIDLLILSILGVSSLAFAFSWLITLAANLLVFILIAIFIFFKDRFESSDPNEYLVVIENG